MFIHFSNPLAFFIKSVKTIRGFDEGLKQVTTRREARGFRVGSVLFIECKIFGERLKAVTNDIFNTLSLIVTVRNSTLIRNFFHVASPR